MIAAMPPTTAKTTPSPTSPSEVSQPEIRVFSTSCSASPPSTSTHGTNDPTMIRAAPSRARNPAAMLRPDRSRARRRHSPRSEEAHLRRAAGRPRAGRLRAAPPRTREAAPACRTPGVAREGVLQAVAGPGVLTRRSPSCGSVRPRFLQPVGARAAPDPCQTAAMDWRQVARLLAVGRVMVGVGLLVATRPAGRLWMGAAADHPTTRFAIRTMAGRDLALGLGTLRALDQDEGARTGAGRGACRRGRRGRQPPGGAPLGHGASIRDGDRGRLRSSSRGGRPRTDWAESLGGGGGNRTRVRGFAGPCLNHSATPPWGGHDTAGPSAARWGPPARRRHNGDVRVTAKVDYAVRATIVLAAQGASEQSPVKGDRIAEAQDIPVKYMEAILSDLRQAGLVRSRRGADGGYWLDRPADEISVADVIRAVEGPIANVRGERPEAVDYPAGVGQLQEVWIATRAALRSVLEVTTLADVARGELPSGVEDLAANPDAWSPTESRSRR